MTQVMIEEEFAEESTKGQLARRIGNHLVAKGAGFLRTDAKFHRLSLFQALNHIFWCVTPKLKKSLNRDLSKVSGDVKIGFRDIEHLLGAERAKEPQQDSAEAQLQKALSAVLQGKEFFTECALLLTVNVNGNISCKDLGM
jgi:tryptophan 2,3-dioxygenase